ncbi:hypothetical protein [Pseudomonas sp. RA_35y_Pfl2_P32]|uniref:hypothetical protein n=1 Tax=Pseudomonas sp. RA_35y_Pfl2_P32 TaxID=3088705 RepID=UPI0030D91BFE
MTKLIIDDSLMVLDGWLFRNSEITPTHPPPKSFGVRVPSSGSEPFRYSSDSDNVEVDEVCGQVISRRDGKAVVTVTAADGQTASYPVQVSNVEYLFGTGAFSTYTRCKEAAERQQGRIPSLKEWNAYFLNYGKAPSLDRWSWTSDLAEENKRWAFKPSTGEKKTLRDFGFGGDLADGFGIRGSHIIVSS